MMRSPAKKSDTAVRAAYRPVLIIAFYLATGLLYMAFVPPFEGPDEPQHFAYVMWLARTGSLPPAGEAAYEAGIDHEASQHPFYYMLAALPGRLIDVDESPVVYRPNPHFVGPLARDYPDNDNRAIHYEGDARPLAGGWLAFYLTRGVTLLFGALFVAGVYALARQIWPAMPAAALQCATLAAAMPQALFLGAVISNDIPVAALGVWSLWALALLLRRGYSASRGVLLGALFGLAVLTKASALALAAPLALGLLWLRRREQHSWGQFARMAVVVGGMTLLVSGWWFARSWALFGSPFGLETHAATTWAIVDPADVELAGRRWWEVFRSFWLWFGWGTVRADPRFYMALAGLTLLAIIGIGRAALRRVRAWREWRAPLPPGAILSGLAAIAVLATALLLELWMRQVIAPFGRLLYPALGAIVVLLVAGWRAIHRHFAWAVAAFLLVVTMLAPWMVLQPAYAQPRLLAGEEVETLGSSLGLRFGASYDDAFAELISLQVLRNSVAAGDVAPVRVCWRALKQTGRDYSLLLQIIGPQERRVAGRRTYPGLGAYPTSQWQAGDVFCDRVQIEIGSEPAVEPLVYQLEVAMIDAQRNQRLPIFGARGESLSVAFVDRIRVYSPSLVRVASRARSGDAETLQLLNYAVPQRDWRPGETYPFTLDWSTSQPVSADYQTFVHLRAPDATEPIAQADGPPLDGWYPTSWWPPGEVITDMRQFSLSAATPPGTYHLYVGLYELSGGQRVTAEYDLGEIVVR